MKTNYIVTNKLKKKRGLLIIFFCLFGVVLYSQNSSQQFDSENIEYYIQNRKIGLRDKSTHKIVVGCKYDYIGGYGKTNRSSFKSNSLYGYLDNTGCEIIKPRFQKANSFTYEGYASVMMNDKWGIINNTGTAIIACKYDEIGNIKFGVFSASVNGKWALISMEGDQLSQEYDEKFNINDQGFASVKKNGLSGIIDKNGKEVIPCKYAECYLTEGLVMIKDNMKWGYYDFWGNNIIPVECSNVGHFYSGVALIQRDDKYMIIGSDTRTLATFDKGWLTDIMKGDKDDPVENPIFIYHKDGEECVVDKTGKIIIPFDKNIDFEYFYGSGLIGAKRNGKYGFYDIFTGKEKIPFEYDETYYYFSKGYISAKKNGMWGVIDTSNRTVIDFKYDKVDVTYSSYLKVQKGTYWGIVSCDTGKEVVPCKYDEVGFPNKTLRYCSVKLDGKSGYADFYGNDTL